MEGEGERGEGERGEGGREEEEKGRDNGIGSGTMIALITIFHCPNITSMVGFGKS